MDVGVAAPATLSPRPWGLSSAFRTCPFSTLHSQALGTHHTSWWEPRREDVRGFARWTRRPSISHGRGSAAASQGPLQQGDPSSAACAFPLFAKPFLSCHQRDAVGSCVSADVSPPLSPLSTLESQTRLNLKKQNVSGPIAGSMCSGKSQK